MACKHCNRKDGTCGCRCKGEKMKERVYYTALKYKKNDSKVFVKSALMEYPQEDLFEDGELSDDKHDLMHRISEVEYKILQMWRNDKIVIARWEKLG